jgi:hypothetical protein
MIKITSIFLLIACFCSGGFAQSSLEAKLRERVLLYHSYFLNGQPKKMWDMSSKKLRRENDNDRAEFIRQMPVPPSGRAKTRLISLKVNGRVAKARVSFDLLPVGTDKWVSEVYDETWKYERGNWFFDGNQLTEDK